MAAGSCPPLEDVRNGNVAESATLADMLKGLTAPKGALVIMDAGIATAANIAAGSQSKSIATSWSAAERGRQFDPGKAVEHADGVQRNHPAATRIELTTARKSGFIAIPPDATPRRPRSPGAS